MTHKLGAVVVRESEGMTPSVLDAALGCFNISVTA